MAGARELDRHDGMIEYLHHDETEDRFALELVSDVAPVIERNKALFNDGDGFAPSREWRRVASFPPIMREIAKRIWGADPFLKGNEELLRRLLNDPDLRHFRTAPGRI
ncbi:MAG: hypothetical protein JO010_02330 [Alphaproteobacteria bacterium]|nr:hypothetical protein [Alphaproteobacteria bacterium]